MAQTQHPHGTTVADGRDVAAFDVKRITAEKLLTEGVPKAYFYREPEDWQRITESDDLYQFTEEMALLEKFGDAIASRMGRRLVEFGPGNFAKTRLILDRLPVDRQTLYTAVDICPSDVQGLAGNYDPQRVHIIGYKGTFGKGLEFARGTGGGNTYISLGCSASGPDLRHILGGMLPGEDFFFTADGYGLEDRDKMEAAYHPAFDTFILSGLNGLDLEPGDWQTGCTIEAPPDVRHRIFLRAVRNTRFRGDRIPGGTTVECFVSHKHPREDIQRMCEEENVEVMEYWQENKMYLYHVVKN